ncbi:type VI secretion system tip protein VgrG [Thiorhodococcus mannitoliphagus]|uniref:Type VI secretion system tip protein VgrG n=1 Tax=Thiorhodococcus mannitoliphagus TaxID=329406 RepID=A0A6P1E1M6_9GAMM|nr:type VI secretion system tip protein TssI/VgrG [Thiorhodococcus mannitoliphagus]NEX22402.1 type VI secretion system tip protein VgrG [Thiorhodococcus mannitoliphagus]
MPSGSAYSQNARLIGLETPLGEDVLLLRGMVARERLSSLFEFELELLSEDDQISAADLLGQSATVRLEMQDQNQRFFNGFISRFSHAGFEGRLARYRATLVPWLWLLTRTSDCRIFQAMTAPDIIKQVFRDAGFTDFDDRLSADYRTWEYCVQYRETHFNFVSRLMEQEGIYWYFTHEDGKHKLVMADGYSAHQPMPGYAEIPYHAADLAAERDEDFIFEWSSIAAVRPGAYVHDAFDFKKPSSELRTSSAMTREHAQADYEIYDYPGEYVAVGEGERYAGVRMEELQSDHEIAQGQSFARGLAVGHLFTLTDYPRADQNREYLVLSAEHALQSDTFQSADGAGSAIPYRSSFTAMDAREPFRAPRLTPKPVVQGPQTATVVGPAGEEIWTDAYGRIKVQFHWDRYGQMDENSSCWVRVSQLWAGGKWGAMHIPRIGQEVIVDFLEGDPNQPIVTGRVYNADQPVPYELPKWAGYSTLRSHTTKDGAVNDFNELRFDDRKDKEQVFLHAQRRMDLRVKRNKYETVQGSSSTQIGGGHVLTIGKSFDLHVKEDVYARADGQVDLSTGGDLLVDIGGGAKVHVSQGLEQNATSILLEGKTHVTLKCGGSYVKIAPDGITLQGPMVRINCGGGTPGASSLTLTDPLDAAGADTGVPGYVDNLPRGGGGGRRTRHVGPERARSVTRNADGSVNYGGSGIRISGSDAFVDSTVATLDSLDGTQTGHQLIDNLQSNGHVASIEEDPAASASGGGGLTTMTTPNSFPAGTSVDMGSGGIQTSDGSGSDSVVNWQPGNNAQYTDDEGNTHTQPDEALLGHELNHADHNARGNNGAATPDPADPTGNQEESRTIGINDHADEAVSENNILRDMGEDWRRTDHDSGAQSAS